MPTAAGTLESLALELGKALHPLKDLMRPDIFVRLGTELPSAIAGSAGINNKITAAANKASDLEPKIQALAGAIAELITNLKDLGDTVHSEANSLPPADRAAIQALAEKLAVRILEYSGVGYLDEKMPALTTSLNLIGLIDKETVTPPELEVLSLPKDIIPRRFNLDRLPDLLNKPDQ